MITLQQIRTTYERLSRESPTDLERFAILLKQYISEKPHLSQANIVSLLTSVVLPQRIRDHRDHRDHPEMRNHALTDQEIECRVREELIQAIDRYILEDVTQEVVNTDHRPSAIKNKRP